MVLEAGDQPFPHLNLYSRAHHSQSGLQSKRVFAAGKTDQQPCETLDGQTVFYLCIC